jgi:hypothetical protein
MLRTAREVDGFELSARDGRIGHVVDLLFDDRRWTIRYLVVDTGNGLDRHEVLISPHAIETIAWPLRMVRVALSRQQVEESPAVDANEPLSPDQEQLLAQYYSWPMYWNAAGFTDGLIAPLPPFLPIAPMRAARPRTASSLDEQHHIRRASAVRGYRIEATDGEIGHIDEFIFDDTGWALAYVVVDTRNWLPGRRVLVSPDWIFEVGWDEAKVFVDLSRETIRHGPEFDPRRPLTADYTDRLHAHYGLPRRSAEP